MNVHASVNKSEIAAHAKAIGGKSKELRKQVYIAVNKTAAKTKSFVVKSVAKNIVVPQKIVKKTVKVIKAKPLSGISKTSAKVKQKAWNGFPVKMLKPVQNGTGVTFKGKGRKSEHIAGAFMGPKIGMTFRKFKGHAFKRAGQDRLPIEKQYGPPAIEIFIESGTERKAVSYAGEQLKKEILLRARFIGLKKSGAI